MAVHRTFDVVAFRRKYEAVCATSKNGIPTEEQLRMNGIHPDQVANELSNCGYDAAAAAKMLRSVV